MKFLLFVLLCFSYLVNTAGIISEISYEGNKHTKEHIINRELTFHLGDTLSFDLYEKEIQQSKNNLLNSALFNFVTISFCDSLEFTKVKIQVTERWYIWPEVILKFQERNFTEWLVNRDLSRIDYGIYVSHLNFRGRQEKLQLQFKTGFNQKIGILYQVPYINKNMKTGLSIGISYNTQNEVFTDIGADNKMIYTKNPNDILLEKYNIHLEYTRRNNLYTRHYLIIDFDDVRLKNELLIQKDHYFNDAEKAKFISISYFLKNDRRDSRNYPLNGFYNDLEITQNGLGILQNSFAFTKLTANYRRYFFLKSRWYLAFGSFIQAFSTGKTPFYLQDGLGFHDYVRSYEPYVIFGQVSSLAKAQVKFQLLKPKVQKIPFIKAEKFSKIHYAVFSNLFIDGGYVYNSRGALRTHENEFLLGAGAGLDLVTFYDLVWRVEYSINKYLEHGIYISFVAPI